MDIEKDVNIEIEKERPHEMVSFVMMCCFLTNFFTSFTLAVVGLT